MGIFWGINFCSLNFMFILFMGYYVYLFLSQKSIIVILMKTVGFPAVCFWISNKKKIS